MSDDALKMRGPVHGTKDARRVAIGSGVGAVIETYDFIGFGTAAALYFGTAFFPGQSPVAGTLAAFATLGVGFLARPLGGIIGGHLGDKVGRKPVLVASLILMGLATFAIGLLPTYAMVGIESGTGLVIQSPAGEDHRRRPHGDRQRDQHVEMPSAGTTFGFGERLIEVADVCVDRADREAGRAHGRRDGGDGVLVEDVGHVVAHPG